MAAKFCPDGILNFAGISMGNGLPEWVSPNGLTMTFMGFAAKVAYPSVIRAKPNNVFRTSIFHLVMTDFMVHRYKPEQVEIGLILTQQNILNARSGGANQVTQVVNLDATEIGNVKVKWWPSFQRDVL